MEEVDGHFWYLRYPFEDGSGHVTVATTRPETMLGDTAVATMTLDDDFTVDGRAVKATFKSLCVFTKKDGTPRTMLCTRNMESVPTDKHPKGTGKVKASHLIVAFDLEKGEWRSFDPKSLLFVERVTD